MTRTPNSNWGTRQLTLLTQEQLKDLRPPTPQSRRKGAPPSETNGVHKVRRRDVENHGTTQPSLPGFET